MSLVEKIGLAFRRKSESARDAYLKALKGGDPETIASAAVAAGIEPERIEADAGILDRAAELISVATNFPKLQEQTTKLVKAAEAAQQKLDTAIAPLMAELDRTTLLAQQAQHDELAARNSIGTLAALCAEYPHLLTLTTMPAAVKDFVKSDAAREAAEAADRAKVAQIATARIAVRAAEIVYTKAVHAASNFVPYDASVRRGAGDAEIVAMQNAAQKLAAAEAEYADAREAGKPQK